jgi:uncharacterized protein (DUF58 family)
MPWTGWTFRGKNRLLELSVGGRWYLGFTVGLGIAAVYSGNNVIYLLESLLLSSLLLSGALSELTLARVAVSRAVGNIYAGSPGEDFFVVENLGSLPLYCLEIGEYEGRNRELTAFLLFLPAKGRVKVRSRQTLSERGRHRWDGLLIATSFPFGFARKIKTVAQPGSRIVWPAGLDAGKAVSKDKASKRGEIEVVVGEITPVQPWQDASRVHWPVSARVGELMARPQRWTEPREEIWLELRDPGPEMERQIGLAAGALSRRADTLVLLAKGEPQIVQGAHRALDALALLPKKSKEGAP